MSQSDVKKYAIYFGIAVTIILMGMNVYTLLQPSPATVSIPSSGIYTQTEGDVDITISLLPTGTPELTSIQWGEIEAGTIANFTFWVINSGPVVTTLALDATNWYPLNATFNMGEWMTFTWDYSGVPINPGRARQVTLHLEPDLDTPAIGEFRFDVVVIGS